MGLAFFVVQLFYAWRLWNLSAQNLALPLSIGLMTCGQLASIIWIVVFVAQQDTLAETSGIMCVPSFERIDEGADSLSQTYRLGLVRLRWASSPPDVRRESFLTIRAAWQTW